jgi:hypothetical protein
MLLQRFGSISAPARDYADPSIVDHSHAGVDVAADNATLQWVSSATPFPVTGKCVNTGTSLTGIPSCSRKLIYIEIARQGAPVGNAAS